MEYLKVSVGISAKDLDAVRRVMSEDVAYRDLSIEFSETSQGKASLVFPPENMSETYELLLDSVVKLGFDRQYALTPVGAALESLADEIFALILKKERES